MPYFKFIPIILLNNPLRSLNRSTYASLNLANIQIVKPMICPRKSR